MCLPVLVKQRQDRKDDYHPLPNPKLSNAKDAEKLLQASASGGTPQSWTPAAFCLCCITVLDFFFGLDTISSNNLRDDLAMFRVDSFSLINFMLASYSVVSFTSDIRFTARNPFKETTLSYSKINASIWYGLYPIAEAKIDPFYTERVQETSFSANVVTAGSLLDQSGGQGIKDATVKFYLILEFEGRLWAMFWRALGMGCSKFKMFCGYFSVRVPENQILGTLTRGHYQCRKVARRIEHC